MTNKYEKIGAIIGVLVGCFYLLSILQINTYTPNPIDIGARAFPAVAGSVFTLLCLTWVISTFRNSASNKSDNESDCLTSDFSWLRFFVLAVLSLVAVALLRPVGFTIVALLYLFTSILVMIWERPTRKQLLIAATVSIIGAVLIKLLLVDLLGIYLP